MNESTKDPPRTYPATGEPATSPISKYWCGHRYFIPLVLLQVIRNLNVFMRRAFRKPSTLVCILSKNVFCFSGADWYLRWTCSALVQIIDVWPRSACIDLFVFMKMLLFFSCAKGCFFYTLLVFVLIIDVWLCLLFTPRTNMSRQKIPVHKVWYPSNKLW